MKRRSFALSGELMSRLADIKQRKRFASLSEAMRFCIAFTFEKLMFQTAPELIEMVEKNTMLLRFILIEVVKIQGGDGEMSAQVRERLQQINREISNHLPLTGKDATDEGL